MSGIATARSRRRTLARACDDIRAFSDLVGMDDFCTRWNLAGSVRRREPLVGDIEYVVIPRVGPRNVSKNLFPDEKEVNLLWHRLDELLPTRQIAQAVNANGQTRWGGKQRAVLFRGFVHEIYTTTAADWGSALAIRTGPADFSRYLVMSLWRNGLKNEGGHVVNSATGALVPAVTEERYFELCGVPFLHPKQRASFIRRVNARRRRH